ncbi:MAG: hypothetical protein ACK41Y_06815 [Paracoccus hibiscisoli]|uniref:hypothetical protein n=1 Tax=Paracoccus hibiscisoli TaxID=2023261 RepID=UPI00391A769F
MALILALSLAAPLLAPHDPDRRVARGHEPPQCPAYPGVHPRGQGCPQPSAARGAGVADGGVLGGGADLGHSPGDRGLVGLFRRAHR